MPTYIQTVTRELTETDLTRFRIYAPFIEEVIEPVWRTVDWLHMADKRAWDMLASILSPGCLPNLRRISRSGAVLDTYCEPIHLFIGPRLQDLTFFVLRVPRHPDSDSSAIPEHDGTTKVLMTLAQHPVDIRRLEISGTGTGSNVQALLTDVIVKLPRLQSYRSFGDLSILPHALEHFASSHTLQSLDIHVNAAQYPLGVPSTYRNAFSCLTNITVRADTVEWCVSFAENLGSPSIEKISLYASQHASSSSIYARLFAVLAERPFNNSLRALSIEFNPLHNSTSEPVALSLDIISPLFGLRSLQSIRLAGMCYAVLDDHALIQMADAWPHLEAATLCSWYRRDPSAPLATFSGVALLAHRCPQLRTFSIPLEDIAVGHLPTLLPVESTSDSTSRSGSCALRDLGIGGAKIAQADVVPMAAVLSHWFPQLEDVEYFELDGDAAEEALFLAEEVYRGRWDEVADLVRSFATVRAQERRWAAGNPSDR